MGNKQNQETNTVRCHRCGGEGHIKSYSHISGGICFECGGLGLIEVSLQALDEDEVLFCKVAAAQYSWDMKHSKYILTSLGDQEDYSDDLALLATRCEAERADCKDKALAAKINIIHREDGRRVTRGEVRAARQAT